MKKGVLVLCLLFFWASAAISQQQKELDALNSYIHFLNESVHGLVIAHVMLVNNNKELNRYIDLESSKTVDISTADLPSNIFSKPDNDFEFYELSPIELSELCIKNSTILPRDIANDLNSQTRNIVGILNSINQIRFDLEDYINAHDLNEKESVYGVYEYLEEVVSLFERYKLAHRKMALYIKNYYRRTTDQIYLSLYEIHNTTKNILHYLRIEDEASAVHRSKELENDIAKFISVKDTYSGKIHAKDYNQYCKLIIDKSTKVVNLMKDYKSPKTIVPDHELYGKNYYYHNQLLMHFFNWSGPGFVRDMNALLEQLKVPFVYFDAEPYIFKVIYPKKVQEKISLEKTNIELEKPELKISNKSKIASPPIIREEEPTPRAKQKVVVNDKLVRVQIYDHNMIDRDSVTIYFNDVLIKENHLLSDVPLVLDLEVEEGKDNIIRFDPVNLGIIPPNTLAVTYRYQGRRKRIVLESDLDQHQMVQIVLEK